LHPNSNIPPEDPAGKTTEPSLEIVVCETSMLLIVSGISLALNLRVLRVGDVALRYADAVRVGVGSGSKMTVTVKVSVVVFPAASDAVQVTVVVPTGNDEPGGGMQVTTGLGVSTSVAGGRS
tara:strand:+ start:315 stop:680 length:366 start_codon:yes stop_codon:yes gene_type:complete